MSQEQQEVPDPPALLQPRPPPAHIPLEGSYCLLSPLSMHHSAPLYASVCSDEAEERHRYLPDYPPKNEEDFHEWMNHAINRDDVLFYAVIDKATGQVKGRQSYLRIAPEHGSIEVGHILWGPTLVRTRVATEAIFLMAQYAFDVLHYRRFEWKCNAANDKSCNAALRFGFTFEGIFRQHLIVKGQNRDTAWYSMLDKEWDEDIRQAYVSWLDSTNFDDAGKQIRKLSSFRAIRS